ncbi:hypothetical protein GIB67_019353 [Kingdonia uniflora]|uniref:Chalcone-flavonone isomerase family protein n=1 Tax=Kingdonia uniflora TaxID=39325 RepID=A0A7J7M1I9_9MAGN|nr:hypothetical protein GIB67_019353 [Kingdonia uniflora]
MDHNGGSSYVFPTEPIVSNSSGEALFTRVGLFVDNSFNFQEALNCISKAAGALLLWFANGSNSHRSMKVIKFKSLSVYAFGLYVRPDSIGEKLGPKYASVPVNELNNRPDFYEDLLREDIHMTVRLVVNCNGLKINTIGVAHSKELCKAFFDMNIGDGPVSVQAKEEIARTLMVS